MHGIRSSRSIVHGIVGIGDSALEVMEVVQSWYYTWYWRDMYMHAWNWMHGIRSIRSSPYQPGGNNTEAMVIPERLSNAYCIVFGLACSM